MTSRGTFLNSCLLALGVRVPKATAAIPIPAASAAPTEAIVFAHCATPISWAQIPIGGTDGSILTCTDHGYCWVHVEP